MAIRNLHGGKMQAYRIANFERLYEIDLKSRARRPWDPPIPLKDRRRSPLPYIRLESAGHKLTATERQIAKKVPADSKLFDFAVQGFYVRLVMIAADLPRELRGWILDDRSYQPLNLSQIAELLNIFDITILREAMAVLIEVELVESREFPETPGHSRKLPDAEKPETPGRSRTLPDVPGHSRKLPDPKVRELPETPGHSRTFPDIPGAFFETETEEKRIRTERSSEFNNLPSVSASDCSGPDAAQIEHTARQTLTALKRLFRVTDPEQQQANETTLTDIVLQVKLAVLAGRLNEQIFRELVREAKECQPPNAKNPIGAFITRAKKDPYFYKPVGKQASIGALVGRAISKLTPFRSEKDG